METLIRSKELEAEILADRKIMFLSIITILILTVIAGYFYSRKILLNRKMIILSKEDQLSMSKLEFKERELVSLSTQMLREKRRAECGFKTAFAECESFGQKK